VYSSVMGYLSMIIRDFNPDNPTMEQRLSKSTPIVPNIDQFKR